ncbi:7,8-didemethyl-8-hydroxy-5-deazariboflavin synthase CofG [Microbacterium forte]|uniref:7,8-didemethyl-8-hydroxy-5-deazariboflavin synthase CofG n=1 Tax=Microbacterium forte TaxID=2982533 RepID=UPI002892FCE5|nr:7,8-didemethyl-8-hydroxy-5-deazariboflavin synthase CofG [Microbacterium sp. A(2022)]
MVSSALLRARRGEQLDADDAETLLAAKGDEFNQLVALAGTVRDTGLEALGRPGTITYSRKVFVPLTTLCRDRCHYCVFVDTPGQLLKKNKPAFMSPDQVLAVARKGASMGCKEALLTLGDRPEDRWGEARDWLRANGYASTLEYVGAMARLITAETGLLAHLNPGVMYAEELRQLRPSAASMGMMLETTSQTLFNEPGQVHFGSPDKEPSLRLQVIEDAGIARIPFTTGILVGIGETLRDRAESLVALRASHERHGHIQEVIVQNFRAKPRTAMNSAADADITEYVAAIAVTRLLFGPAMRVQVPPNLSDSANLDLLLRAGADDWGGVSPLTADHVNPERPWPHLNQLAASTAESGFVLRERLTAHPEFVSDAMFWIDPGLHAAVTRVADPETGLARFDAHQERPESNEAVDGPSDNARANRKTSGSSVRLLAERAASNPLDLDDYEWTTLLLATGADLDAVTATADDVRRYTVGEAVSIVINRNLASSAYRLSDKGQRGTFGIVDVPAIAHDAWSLGINEICVQGRVPDDEPPEAYIEIVDAIKEAAPRIHVHAYGPRDVWDLANRGGFGIEAALIALRTAGVSTMPGTGVKVLSERVRDRIAPSDPPVERWIEAVKTAHRLGIRSSSVLFYGHVETAAERITHLRVLRSIQDETNGFTEFVPIPLPGGGVCLAPDRSLRDEHRAMVAVSRLILSGSIPHIQVPWTRLGLALTADLLRSGGDDLGGTLLDGRVLPDVGAEHGLELPVKDAARVASRLFRPLRQRMTDYQEPASDRKVPLR